MHRALAARAVDVAMRTHLGAGAKRRVLDPAERADAHAIAQFDASFEHHVDVDLDVTPDDDLAADIQPRRIGHACSGRAQRTRLAELERAFQLGQLPGIIGTLGFDRVARP